MKIHENQYESIEKEKRRGLKKNGWKQKNEG